MLIHTYTCTHTPSLPHRSLTMIQHLLLPVRASNSQNTDPLMKVIITRVHAYHRPTHSRARSHLIPPILPFLPTPLSLQLSSSISSPSPFPFPHLHLTPPPPPPLPLRFPLHLFSIPSSSPLFLPPFPSPSPLPSISSPFPFPPPSPQAPSTASRSQYGLLLLMWSGCIPMRTAASGRSTGYESTVNSCYCLRTLGNVLLGIVPLSA